MKEQEQNLLNAAREILSDFDRYGEVLQHGDNGEYGTESSIGMLSAAIHQYNESTLADPQHGREPDNKGKDVYISGLGCVHVVPDKVKPLGEYLDRFMTDYVNGGHSECVETDGRGFFEQALDAYQSTENVTIKIERV